MDINSLTVGQVKEIAGLAGCLGSPVKGNSEIPNNSSIRIVVLQRGWIVVGKVSQSGETILISNPSIIRNWGTTKGLGEIAEGGPTSKTVLDKCPDINAHALTVVLQMKCDETKWVKHVS